VRAQALALAAGHIANPFAGDLLPDAEPWELLPKADQLVWVGLMGGSEVHGYHS
jgi:hypothetical protein